MSRDYAHGSKNRLDSGPYDLTTSVAKSNEILKLTALSMASVRLLQLSK
jgi:hypothetical protein